MSSLENIYQKMVPTLEPASLAQLHQQPPQPAPEGEISRELAHELNNILTVVQGYTERLMMKHGQDATMRADLKMIADNSKRAVAAIKKAPRLKKGPSTAAAVVSN